MSTTPIEWATHVLNVFTGCDRLSAGCARCYAIPTAAANQRKELGRERKALERGRPAPRRRYYTDGDPRTSGPGFGFRVHWDKLYRPPRIPAGAVVFVNSMSDVFHDQAPTEALVALWSLFASRPDVTWIVLTKREQRMHDVLCGWRDAAHDRNPNGVPSAPEFAESEAEYWRWWIDGLPNVWLGVTIENRAFLRRADVLRATPAAVRVISAEPLLGPLLAHRRTSSGDWWWHRGELVNRGDAPGLDLTAIDWLIVGGESGKGHRRLDLRWMRDLRDACAYTGTAYFVKQLGGDRAGNALEDLPEDLQIRAYPATSTRELVR